MAEIQVADVRAQVLFSLFTDFENFSVFKPAATHEQPLTVVLDQLVGLEHGTLRDPRGVATIGKQEPNHACSDSR